MSLMQDGRFHVQQWICGSTHHFKGRNHPRTLCIWPRFTAPCGRVCQCTGVREGLRSRSRPDTEWVPGCVWMSEYGVSFREHRCLTPSVPSIGSRPTTTLNRLKRFCWLAEKDELSGCGAAWALVSKCGSMHMHYCTTMQAGQGSSVILHRLESLLGQVWKRVC